MLRLFFVAFILSVFNLKGASIKEAYQALSIYDYFKAKKIFHENLKRKPAESSYGLATIYFRTDNPFSNIDSSAKYISKAINSLTDTSEYFGYKINQKTISDLSIKIAEKGYLKYSDSTSIHKLTFFLTHYYFADVSLKTKVYDTRDEIALDYYSVFEQSDSINIFLLRYPQSNFRKKAIDIFYEYQYKELVKTNSITELKSFILGYPNNPFRNNAELILFEKIKQEYSIDLLNDFIKACATQQTIEEAWKYLYGLEIKNYTKKSLLNFLSKYPNYPYANIIYKEIELAEQQLISLKNAKDLYGFIDTTGKWIIKPKFDDAQDFSEGYSAVCLNDSCYYINKNGEILGNKKFSEVEPFYNGVAIVKKQNLYYLLNRSGQLISQGFDEISSNNNNIYVCKKNGLYGAIDAKAKQVIPFVYQKLGDFKNGFSYYQKNKIGLISIKNQTLPDEWDWISEVNTSQLVIVKKNQKFGIINTKGDIILEPNYDLIVECSENVYLLVNNYLYGFYNIQGRCFIANIEYTYKSQLKANEYINGKYFKLYKNNETALMDANGKLIINFGSFQNIWFNENNMLKVQKANKYGFIDYKQKNIIPIEYDYADDMKLETGIVSKSNSYSIIDKQGKVLYSIKNAILKRISASMILVEQNEKFGLINTKGELIVPVIYDTYQNYKDADYLFELNGSMYYFNTSYKFLKQLDASN